MSSFLNKSLEEALEEAKWDAEFSENREKALFEEYKTTKADGGEQGHDGCFPNLSGPGATVWICRDGHEGLLCYFDTLEEGFDFGDAFLKTHTSDLRSEWLGSVNYIEWRDKMGALWAADYNKMDSLNMILVKEKGIIGSSNHLTVGIYKYRAVASIIWSYMNSAFIVPPGLAMVLGPNGTPKRSFLETMKDKRLFLYPITWKNAWQQEALMSCA
jgi:hypothetical protein